MSSSHLKEIYSMPPELIQELLKFYERVSYFFPFELRQLFSKYVEARFCQNYCPVALPAEMQDFVYSIILPLEGFLSSDASQNMETLRKSKLTTALQQLKLLDVPTVYRSIETCITFEMNLLRRGRDRDLLAESLVQAKKVMENLEITLQKLIANAQEPLSEYQVFWSGIKGNLRGIAQLQHEVLHKKLYSWKLQQQRDANFGRVQDPHPAKLNKIQNYLQDLAELIWETRQQIIKAMTIQIQRNIFYDADVLKDIDILLDSLFNEAFVVLVQPHQIMKKRKINVKVVFLIGNLGIKCSEATVQVITEKQAKCLASIAEIEGAMPLLNWSCEMKWEAEKNRFSAKFPNLELKEIKRGEKKEKEDKVNEEKLCLAFQSHMKVENLEFRVRTLSIPVIASTHGSQDSMSDATKFWDNAFGQIGRVPFYVPDDAPWDEIAKLISDMFLHSTGRGLTEEKENLRCLKEKALRGATHLDKITWDELAKKNLPGLKFSFWHWTYHIRKSLKAAGLNKLWTNGRVLGFVERVVAEQLLQPCDPGTFILRFSDSRPGSIAIFYMGDDKIVHAMAPLDEIDFKKKSLANTIRDEKALKFLYPKIPKEEAFGEHYTLEAPAVTPDNPGYNLWQRSIGCDGYENKSSSSASSQDQDVMTSTSAASAQPMEQGHECGTSPSTTNATPLPTFQHPFADNSAPGQNVMTSVKQMIMNMGQEGGPSIITTPSSQPGSPFLGMAMDQGYQFAPSPGQSPYSIPPSVLEQMNPMTMEVPDQVVEDFMTLLDCSDLLQVGDMNDGTPTSNGNNNCQTSDSGGTWSNFVQL